MENSRDKSIFENYSSLKDSYNVIKNFEVRRFSKSVQEFFTFFEDKLLKQNLPSDVGYLQNFDSREIARIIVRAQQAYESFRSPNKEDNKFDFDLNEFIDISHAFENIVESLEDIQFQLSNASERENHLTSEIERKLLIFSDTIQEHEIIVNQHSAEINEIISKAKVEVKLVADAYKKALIEVDEKRTQINDILGHVSGRAIAGDFEKSAAEEQRNANLLRRLSLGCMFSIVAIVAVTFYETTSDAFLWENALVRIILAVILSVPAAYLAKESSKHREQQYTHLQTALDLKAITPYIASLPEGEQHRIKIEIAGRLFASRDFSKLSSDPYPINTHELIIELLKKLEIKKEIEKPAGN